MATNSVTVIGNLVEDPELRFTGSGVAMANIRVAVNRSWRDQSGEWQERTSFFGGTLWREAAENAAESLQKGMRVIITGRLEQRSYETKDGEKRSVTEIRADELGPSLRWAQAQVERISRDSADGGGFSGGGGGGGGGGGAGGGAPRAPEPVYGDEEPF